MKLSRKRIASMLVAGILALSIVGLGLIGNYFVEYALARKEVDFDDPLSPSYEKTDAELTTELAQEAAIQAWLAQSPHQEVSIQSTDDYTLVGHLNLSPDAGHNWVIAVHGYTSHFTSIEDIACTYWNEGYNVLLPELRAHGDSEGEYIGMGYYDSIDMLGWIDCILDIDPDAQIILHGVSMGAATVLCTAGQQDLPDNVIAVIEDCGYTNAYQMMVEQLDYRFGLPEFPIMPVAAIVANYKAGYNLKDANPLAALENADLPILFIHGDADTYVLPYMLDILYDAYDGEKEKLVVADAAHGAARDLEPELYYDTVFAFLDQVA